MRRTKKLLIGFVMCMALAGSIAISQGVQAANDDFIIEDKVLSEDSISDSEIQDEDSDIENDSLVEDETLSQNDIDDSVIQDRAASDDDDFSTGNHLPGAVVDNKILSRYNGKDTDVVIPSRFQKIGSGAFTGCTGVKRITIPQSISDIDRAAFWGCTSLQEIKVDAKNLFFSSENGVLYNKNKTKLITYPEGKSGNFVIPNNVTHIANNAFHNCTDLTSIVISQSVSDIEYCAFGGCTNLTDVVISNSAININYGVFWGTPWLEKMEQENPNQPLIVNNILFKGKIENGIFMIPTGVTSICSDAFNDDIMDYKSITSITIPASVENVGEFVFQGCENLRELTILNPRTKLGHDVSSILDSGDGWTKFNNSVVTVKGYKGSSAEELANYLNNPYRGNTTFKFIPLDGTGGNTPKPTKPKTPNKGTILKSKSTTYKVTKKGSEVAYTKISGMSMSVNIPNTVKIGGISYKVTSVSSNAFKGNKKLSKVTIGANITSIGKNAFSGCKNLKTITIKSTKLKSVGQNAFKGIKSTARIKVPSMRLKAYKKLLKGKGQGKKVKITK